MKYKYLINRCSIIFCLLLSISSCSSNFLFTSETFTDVDYSHSPLCGYSDSTGNPCDEIARLHIYTGVPFERGNTIERQENLNEIAALWINENKLKNENLTMELENIWDRNDFSPSSGGMLKIGVFVFYDTLGAIFTMQSVTGGGVQVVSYFCVYNDGNAIDEKCLINKFNEGMSKLIGTIL